MFPFNKVLVSACLRYTLTTQTTNQAFTGVKVKPEISYAPMRNRIITRLQWCTRDAFFQMGTGTVLSVLDSGQIRWTADTAPSSASP